MQDKAIKYILILNTVVILCFFLWFFACRDTSEKRIFTTHTDTIYIPSTDRYHELRTEVTKPVTVENHYHYETTGIVDTSAVLRDYFSKRIYQDTIKNDSVEIVLNESVFKNELTRNSVKYRWKAPERLVKETIVIKPKGFYAGAFVNFGKQSYGVGPQLSYLFNKNSFGAGVDLINKNIQLTYLRKLGK